MTSVVDSRFHASTSASSGRGLPIRVAWDLGLAERNRTGTRTYARSLTRELARLPDLELRLLRGWPTPSGHLGLVGRTTRALMDAAWVQVGVAHALNGSRVDLLHSPIHLAPLRPPCPLVVTVHDTIHRRFPEDYRGWWINYVRFLLPKVLRRAVAIIADSESTKRDLIDAFAVDPDMVRVIHLGVDLGIFAPEAAGNSDGVLKEFGIRAEYVLHVGAFVGRKNIPFLLEAVAILRRRGTWGVRQLVLAGAPSPGLRGAEAVYQSIERLGLGDIVVLPQHVPDRVLPALYARAAVFAFPSKYEGFGLPLIEAMACGTPVVAKSGSSVTEIAGDAALLVDSDSPVDFADGLDRVLQDRTLESVLCKRGLARAANFSWSRAACSTAQLYREVVGKSTA